MVSKLLWIDAPKWLISTTYLALGWVAVLATPQLVGALGVVVFVLVALGGLASTAGAVI